MGGGHIDFVFEMVEEEVRESEDENSNDRELVGCVDDGSNKVIHVESYRRLTHCCSMPF